MKKVFKYAIAGAFMLPLLANAGIKDINIAVRGEVQGVLNGEPDAVFRWNEEAKEGDYKAFALALQNAEFKNKKEIRNAEDMLIKLIGYRYNMVNNWKVSDIDYPNQIMTDDSIIDLNRAHLATVEFQTIQVGEHDLIDERSETWNVKDSYLSKTLMRSGYPAIGPDGKDIQLCRLFNEKDASFYEIPKSTVSNFIKSSFSGMEVNEACIAYPGAVKDYWEKRYDDLINKYKY